MYEPCRPVLAGPYRAQTAQPCNAVHTKARTPQVYAPSTSSCTRSDASDALDPMRRFLSLGPVSTPSAARQVRLISREEKRY
jgi:hypothetical protein